MLNLSSLMIGTDKHEEMAAFYKKVFQKDPDMDEGGYTGWLVGKTFFTVADHSEIKGESKEPQRIILNLDTDEVKEEFERIKDLGAKVIKEPYAPGDGYWIATLADPDGNYFQLVTPWKDK